MNKKFFAVLLVALLALGLFYLPTAAAPSQDELDGMTPYGLRAEVVGENEAAMLNFQIVGLGADLLGMEPDDDIHVIVESKRGEGEWEIYQRSNTGSMLEYNRIGDGEYIWPFGWMPDDAWDGVEPIYFRAYCEYMQGGDVSTGLRSDYSNVAFIGAGEGVTEPTTIGIAPVPYEEPVVLPAIPSADYTRLIVVGIGLLFVIVIIVILVRKKRKQA